MPEEDVRMAVWMSKNAEAPSRYRTCAEMKDVRFSNSKFCRKYRLFTRMWKFGRVSIHSRFCLR